MYIREETHQEMNGIHPTLRRQKLSGKSVKLNPLILTGQKVEKFSLFCKFTKQKIKITIGAGEMASGLQHWFLQMTDI